MLYQRAPFPPDVDYFLDHALDEDIIHAFDHTVLTLLGDRRRVAAMIDVDEDRKPEERALGTGFRLRSRREIALSLDRYAHELAADLTPALDQVAAIALHARCGDAQTLIDTGNLFAVTPAGAQHPVIATRLALAKRDLERTAATRSTGRASSHDLKRAAVLRYQDATLPIWIDAITQQIWGRDARRLNALMTPLSVDEAIAEFRMAA